MRDARLLGVEKDTEKRFSGERSWDFDVTTQGWRYHMSNIMAAIGIEQLKRFSNSATKRQKIAKQYDSYFKEIDVEVIHHNYKNVVPHIYVLKLPDGVDRFLIREKLRIDGIQTGVHYKNNHHLSLYNSASRKIDKAEKISQTLLSIPLHSDITEQNVLKIIDSIRRLL